MAFKNVKKVKFLAITASIIFHLFIFGAFGVLKFRQSASNEDSSSLPTGSFKKVKSSDNDFVIMPKPKIKRVIKQEGDSQSELIYDFKSDSISFEETIKNSEKKSVASNYSGDINFRDIKTEGTEFFGLQSVEDKILFLVDATGSMKGLYSAICRHLSETINELRPDQYFNVIFFREGHTIPLHSSGFARASGRSKRSAVDFVNKIRPSGKADAYKIFKDTLSEINSQEGMTVYFLTDGFEFINGSDLEIDRKRDALISECQHNVTVNAIAFWPRESDTKVMEEVAGKSGGEFKILSDEDFK